MEKIEQELKRIMGEKYYEGEGTDFTAENILDLIRNEQQIKLSNYFKFLSAVVYYLNNPESKMDIPSMLYEAIERKVAKFPEDRVMTEQEALELAGRNPQD